MFMRRYNLHVLVEVIKLFVVALTAMTLISVLVGVVEKLIAEGLGVFAILQLLPFVLLISLQFVVPATLLFAVCSVFGRMAADNEIVAIKSIGISPIRIVIPVLVFALALSPIAVYLNDLAVSWGRPGINRVVMQSLEEIIYRVLRSHHSYSSHSGFSVHVQDVQDRWLIRPTIVIYGANGGEAQTIMADKAQLSWNAEKENLTMKLVNYESFGSKFSLIVDGSQELELPKNLPATKGENSDSPSQFALKEIGSQIRWEIHKINLNQDMHTAYESAGLLIGRAGMFDDTIAKHYAWVVTASQQRLNRLETEPWRRWAAGFCCFFFVWVGIPLAIWMRSADYWTTFGLCFLPILLIYYPLFALGLDRSKDGSWPPYSVWLGNIVLLAIGSTLLRRVYRS